MINPEEHENPEEQIKRLLLSEELALLDKLRQQCDFLEDRVHDDSSIRETIRPVIIDVLRDAGVEDHERMARVLAPLVLASMREEIRNSSDMMVDALYPITGRLVAAAVSNAFRELLETLNEKLESNFSVAKIQARVKSKITGQSEAEILLQRNPPFTIDELLVIHAPTGLLIAHAGDAQEEAGEGKTALIGSMLTAIISFVREAISDDQSEDLKTLSFGDSQLFVQTSPGIILAVRAGGTKPAGFDGALEALFNDFLSRWTETLSAFDGSLPEDDSIAIVNDLKGRFENLQEQKEHKFRGSSRKPWILLALPLVLLFVWIGYQIVDGRRVAAIEQTAQEIIAGEKELENFDVSARYEPQSKSLVISGLFPELVVQERLASAWVERRPDVPIDFQTRFLPGVEIRTLARKLGDAESSLAALNETLIEIQSENARLDQSIERLTTSVDAQRLDAQNQQAQLQDGQQTLTTHLEGLQAEFATAMNAQREDLIAQQTRLNDQQATLNTQVKDVQAELSTAMDAQREDLIAQQTRLHDEQSTLNTQVKDLQADVATALSLDPIVALTRWTQVEKIQFVDGLQLASPRGVDARLRALVDLLRASPKSVKLHVVGYSDSLGNAASNLRISSERASAIAKRLATMGANPEQLVAVGRSNERLISSAVGEGNINRRVEFEVYRSN